MICSVIQVVLDGVLQIIVPQDELLFKSKNVVLNRLRNKIDPSLMVHCELCYLTGHRRYEIRQMPVKRRVYATPHFHYTVQLVGAVAYREINTVYYGNHTKHIHQLCACNAECLMLRHKVSCYAGTSGLNIS